MDEEGQVGSAFWGVAEEDKPERHSLSKEDRYKSQSRELSYADIEKLEYQENQRQEKLNNEWKDKVPDDMVMMRDEIRNARYVVPGCTALYLLMTISDGGCITTSIQEQIWPLVIVCRFNSSFHANFERCAGTLRR